ncbi:alpha/beta hydrolase [Pseudochryseolinea flava]|uniref:Alpha/beta hydrolase n=1 Tax=Pseudochryseolinea flava TaxID=2059302 RepID=A0A364Y2A5_9BACT|nr:alpha/beta hydrolase [Pseudochryseolinea flava]RAW00780.1 alpha/beta hydrolase [Pseudochryseolinea flava]
MKISFPILVLVGIYFLGPTPEEPKYILTKPSLPSDPVALERFVRAEDAKHKIKPGNEAEIVWVDSSRTKTAYGIVYLHGFSASKMEGEPAHRNLAKAFGCNLFLARLADHGVDTTETLLYYSADRSWESAKQAIAIAKQIGDKVIVLSTSTGGTLALKLAAEYPEDVHALINLSPNIAINDGAAFLLNDPYGLYIARTVLGDRYRTTGASPEHAKYWNKKYRIESLTQLEELLETTMTKNTFSRVKQPSLTLYYYKDEGSQDPEVKVSAMLEMHEQLGTPRELKSAIAFPNAGAHVIGSAMTSKDFDGVYRAMEKFMIDVLKIEKVNRTP